MNPYHLILYFSFWFSIFPFFGSANKEVLNEDKNLKVHFHKIETGSNASLRGLYVVNEKIIWASGSEGTVLRSTDEGESWELVSVPNCEKNDFRSIHAWDENCAIVFGIAGPDFGYFTENGGKSWEIVFRDSTAGVFINSIKFANNKVGLVVGDPIDGKPYLLKTIDGGKTWNRILNIPESKPGEANFAASNTCIEFLPSGKAWVATGGNVARVFYSVDYGETWRVSETPIIQGNPSSGIFSTVFKNNHKGIIVGGTYDKPELNIRIAAYTEDGGKTWILSESMPKEYRSCVQFVNLKEKVFFFAMGKTGSDYSLDDGKNWLNLSKIGYYTFRMVPGKSIGFSSGADGEIARLEFQYLSE